MGVPTKIGPLDGVLRRGQVPSDQKWYLSVLHLAMARYALLLIVFLSGLAKAQCPMPDNIPAGTLDTCFIGRPGFSKPVRNLAVQPDGKILVGGTDYLRRLNPDGSEDSSFNRSRKSIQGNLYGLKFQPDGKILVYGSISSFYGRPTPSYISHNIGRLTADGDLDTAFGLNFQGLFVAFNYIDNLFMQADQKVVITGHYITAQNFGYYMPFRLNPDGSCDRTFPYLSFLYRNIRVVGIQAGGKMLVFKSDSSFKSIYRLNPDGSPDGTFPSGTGIGPDSAGSTFLAHTATDQQGRIILYGQFGSYNGRPCKGLIRLLEDGSVDTTFKIDPSISAGNFIYGLFSKPDGKILVSAEHRSYATGEVLRLVQLHQNGLLDTSFARQTEFNFSPYHVTFQADGKLLAGGWFTQYNGENRTYLARLFTDRSSLPVARRPANPPGSFSLHPNPASSTVTLTGPEPIAEATLISADGKQVPVALSRENTFSVNGVKPGIYTLLTQTLSGKPQRARLAIQP